MEQLRVSVFVDGPDGSEAQTFDEIPRIVRSEGEAVMLQAGTATIEFTNRQALIALLTRP